MRSLLLVPLLASLLAGCHVLGAGTRIEDVSAGKPVTATLDKVLLVGITTTPRLQADMEQAFARALAPHKRSVVLASQWFPGDKEPLREDVVARVRAEGVTGVLVVRLASYELGEPEPAEPGFSLKAPARTPGARVGWDQDPWLDPAQAPALPQRKAVVETRLYDVASGQVVWSARSRTVLRSDAGEELTGFVDAIVLELRKGGWLPPRQGVLP